MANRTSTTHVIEIETGIGEPAFIPLTLGSELQPISIGKKGMWRVDGARVLDVHAFVYFDGASLFLQSADEQHCASVDGYNIGKAWTELHAPCKIDVGAARLRFRSLIATAEGQATQAAPRPPVQAPPSQQTQPHSQHVANQRPAAGAEPPASFPKQDRPFRPGEFSRGGNDDESTRFAPLDSTGANRTATSGAHGRPGEDDPSTRPEAARVAPRPSASPMQQPMQPNASGPYQAMGQPMGQPMGSVPQMQQPMMQPGMSAPPQPPMQQMQPQQMGSYPGQGSGSYPQQPPYGPGASGPYASMPTQLPGGMPQGSLPPGGYGSMTQQQPAPEPQGFEKFVAQYKEMSVPKRILVVLLPVAMGLTVWSLWDEDEQPPPRPKKVAVADAGAPSASVAGASTVPPVGTGTTAAGGTTPAPWPSNVPCPPPGWPANMPLPCTPNAVQPQPTVEQPTPATGKDAGAAPKEPKEPKDAGATLPAGVKTLERIAVDAVAAGDYAKAAHTYEELSRKDPNNRVYAEAARILRNRLDGGL